MGLEIPLSGGNVATAVVRVGDTVRKPVTAATAAIEAVLTHLEQVNFSGAPRTLGRDGEGRHVLEYVDGPIAHTSGPMTVPELRRLGRLVRDLHEALASFTAPPGARWATAIRPDRMEQVCHHDLAPWNLVLAADRWTFIDWDAAGPGSRGWDLAYAAQTCTPLHPGGDPRRDGRRLRALVVDGYGLEEDQRPALPELMAARTRAMCQLLVEGARTGRQPWARLHAEGHADFWGPAADYVAAHQPAWTEALRT